MIRNEIAWPTTRTLFVSTTTGYALTYWSLRHLLRRLGEQAGVKVPTHAFRRGAAIHHAEMGGSDRMGMARGRWKSQLIYGQYTRSVSLEPIKQLRWRGGQVPKVGVEPTRPQGALRP